MAGSWLDALLGAVFNSGVEVPISGGLNFTGALRAVLNGSTGRVDVSLPPGAAGAGAVVTQTDWAPLSEDSDELVVMAAGHTPGFYLVGLGATYAGTSVSGGAPTGTVMWASDGQTQTRTQDAENTATSDTSAAWHVPTALVYSDGSADIKVAMADASAAGFGIVATVRATATRQAST